jgi:molecular chaperone GrpE
LDRNLGIESMNDEELPPANDGSEPLPNEVEALKAEIESMRDRLLRALADGENTRRRAEREKSEASLYAVTKFARDMLGIADNFARALAACPPVIRAAADPQIQAVLDGVEATDRQLVSTLERHGVTVIDTEDGKFDPNLHQAIAEVPGEGRPPGSIVNVVQTGYRIGERLLRPAMVTVARKGDAPAPGVDTKI